MASISQVVDSGVCVGCGACGVITGREIPLTVNSFGIWQARPDVAPEEARELGARVCPFADESPDETVLSDERFPELTSDPQLGRFSKVFAAQVNDDDYLMQSSSGGLTSWVLQELLGRGLVDGVIHVGAGGDHELFAYIVSHTADEVVSHRKSAYYSTSMMDAVLSVKGNGKRYALVGVPCFISAARLLARTDDVLREQLCYFVGLVCGHLKSAAFAELLAWQLGVPPTKLASVDFRVKNPARSAGSYDFQAVSRNGDVARRPSNSLIGGNWGHALFQLDACNYCDDVFAETADIVFGDAWLPEYTSDWRGHNVVVTRNRIFDEIIGAESTAGRVTVLPLSPSRAADSQAGNFRHRREGLQLRLHDDQCVGRWTPRKRQQPSRDMPRRRRAIIRARRILSAASHTIFLNARKAGSLELFEEEIAPLIANYARAYRASFLTRAHRLARRILTSRTGGTRPSR